MDVNNLFALTHFHLFQINIIYWYQTYITFPWLLAQFTEQKTGNDAIEFIHSNWITLSYYSSNKHKSLLHRYLMHLSDFSIL